MIRSVIRRMPGRALRVAVWRVMQFCRLAVSGKISLNRGRCNICGRSTVFVGMDSTDEHPNDFCFFCRSISRNRLLAKYLIHFYNGHAGAAADAGSLKDMGRGGSAFTVYQTETRGAACRYLSRMTGYVNSEYFGDREPGSTVNGVRNEDLQRLTFGDRSFDLVITEDVFEHIADYHRAFSEIGRVLKPGGAHIFTVSPYIAREETLRRIAVDGTVLIEPVVLHGDANSGQGVPVFTEFGFDIRQILEGTGMDVSMYDEKDEALGLFRPLQVIVAIKK